MAKKTQKRTRKVASLAAKPRKGAALKGGSLNAYYESVTGEKQGKFKGG